MSRMRPSRASPSAAVPATTLPPLKVRRMSSNAWPPWIVGQLKAMCPSTEVLHRGREHLPVREVVVAVGLGDVDPADAEAQVGVRGLDVHAVGARHQPPQRLLAPRDGRPVEVAGAVEVVLQLLEREAGLLRHAVGRVPADHPARAVDPPVEQGAQHSLVGEILLLIHPGEHHGVLLRGDADRDVDLLEKGQAVRGEVGDLLLGPQAVEVAGDLREGELYLDVAGAALQAGAVNRLEQRLALLAGSGDEHDVAALHAGGIAGDECRQGGRSANRCICSLLWAVRRRRRPSGT